jgi:hypothetical protein
MGLIHVKTIGFEPTQAGLNLALDRRFAQVTMDRAVRAGEKEIAFGLVPDEAAFGRKNDFIATACDSAGPKP